MAEGDDPDNVETNSTNRKDMHCAVALGCPARSIRFGGAPVERKPAWSFSALPRTEQAGPCRRAMEG
jgi:hypothetical protein